jgi:hypothetical protein
MRLPCYPHDLYDFYLLYFAYSDLQDASVQWYWEGATRDNILAIIGERAAAFVGANGRDTSNPCSPGNPAAPESKPEL